MNFKQLREKYRSKYPASLVAAAVKIALDMAGAMTPAVKKIEAMKKGLSNDPMVKDALRMANESVNESLQENVKAVMKKHKKHIDKWKRNNKPMPIQVEDDLMQAAMKAGEIKTDDPDEFDDWLDRNL